MAADERGYAFPGSVSTVLNFEGLEMNNSEREGKREVGRHFAMAANFSHSLSFRVIHLQSLEIENSGHTPWKSMEKLSCEFGEKWMRSICRCWFFLKTAWKMAFKLRTVSTNVLYVSRAMTGTNLRHFRSVLWRW